MIVTCVSGTEFIPSDFTEHPFVSLAYSMLLRLKNRDLHSVELNSIFLILYKHKCEDCLNCISTLLPQFYYII